MRLLTRRRVAVLGALGVLALAGSAFAYWTGTSSGTGQAVAGNPGSVVLTGTVPSGIAPGTNRTVTFTGANSTSSPIYVTTITLSSITPDAGHSTCVVTDFSMPDVSEGVEVPANATAFAFPTNGTLSYRDSTSNQDACKGATLSLVLAGS